MAMASERPRSGKARSDLTWEDLGDMLNTGEALAFNSVRRWRSSDGTCELTTLRGALADAPTWLGQPMAAVD